MTTAIQKKQEVVIAAPNFKTGVFRIRGTAPYVQNAFPEKVREMIRLIQEAGPQAKKGKKRDPKDFQACYEGAQHMAVEGWNGIPAPAFRAGMVSACRVVGFAMTRAKLSVFVEADGFDAVDATPLVKILKGKPRYVEHAVKNETGVCDIRARPMWDPGWEADVRVRFDGDQFSMQDVANLLLRVGAQVGIGEGRADSRKSAGMGWGFFELVGEGN